MKGKAKKFKYKKDFKNCARLKKEPDMLMLSLSVKRSPVWMGGEKGEVWARQGTEHS
jgi:hypothetical protein